MKAWLDHNRHSFGLALRRMTGAPFAALFSILVIGIALSLPAGLYALLQNAERLAGQLPAQPEITLFLKTDLTEDAGRQLAGRIAGMPHVARARFVTRDEGLKHLQEAGLDDLTSGLGENPLPDVIAVATDRGDPADMEKLADQLRGQPGVDHAVMDDDWARRLAALLDFGHDMVWLLAILFGIALAAIVGNTIRLQIYAAHEEIEVSRLIGATHRFIRRPFLYFGFLQGLFGGLAGWAIVSGSLFALETSLGRLALAWNGQIALAGLAPADVGLLLAISSALGFAGAFLAVGHSLGQIDRAR